jgi:hypothetical protein
MTDAGGPALDVAVDWKALSPDLRRTARLFTWGLILLCAVAAGLFTSGIAWSSPWLISL